jgi:hypothetical protein
MFYICGILIFVKSKLGAMHPKFAEKWKKSNKMYRKSYILAH